MSLDAGSSAQMDKQKRLLLKKESDGEKRTRKRYQASETELKKSEDI